LALIAGSVLNATALVAQLAVRPAVVMLSETSRIADFQVRNESTAAQEVTIGFRFGYAQSDASGRPVMIYDDSVAAREHGMTSWAAAFPRRFVLPPGAEQTVRLTARPPAGLAAGVYWTRLVTAAQRLSAAADAGDGGVQPQMIVRVEQVTSVLFRRGAVAGGVIVGALTIDTNIVDPAVLIPVTPTGNVPFIGQARTTVRNARGQVVQEARAPLNAYGPMQHRVALPRGLVAGRYAVDVRVDNERGDLATGALPRVAPVIARATFVVP